MEAAGDGGLDTVAGDESSWVLAESDAGERSAEGGGT